MHVPGPALILSLTRCSLEFISNSWHPQQGEPKRNLQIPLRCVLEIQDTPQDVERWYSNVPLRGAVKWESYGLRSWGSSMERGGWRYITVSLSMCLSSGGFLSQTKEPRQTPASPSFLSVSLIKHFNQQQFRGANGLFWHAGHSLSLGKVWAES